MKALQTMAGFVDADGMYFNPRTAVNPPEEIEKMIFPFVETSLEHVTAVCNCDGIDNHTAISFSKLLKVLCKAVLQDAAAIAVLHPVQYASVKVKTIVKTFD